MSRTSPRWANILLVVLLAVFAGRVIYHSSQIAPIYDESVHLVSGYAGLRWDDYRLNPEHPPLVKKLAALPLLALDPLPESLDLSTPIPHPGPGSLSWQHLGELWRLAAHESQAQWWFAHELLYGVRDEVLQAAGVEQTRQLDTLRRIEPGEFLNNADRLFFWARLPVLIFGLLVCGLVYAWASQLYGWAAGLLALAVCAFDPNLVAHSSLVTTDAAATALIFGTVYGLWRFASEGRWLYAVLAVLFCALAFTAKFSALLLAPILILLVAVALLPSGTVWQTGRAQRLVPVLVACGLVSILAVWEAYGWRFEGMAEDQAGAAMPIEAKLQEVVELEAEFDPRVRGRQYLGLFDRIVSVANRHQLLPEAYLYGLAHARLESRARPAFLRGEYAERGFRSFFAWTVLLKTPLVSLLAIVAALIFVLPKTHWRSGIFLVLPAVILFGSAIGSHLNIGHRHLLPIYPFLYVLVGGLMSLVPITRREVVPRRLVVALIVVAVSSTVVFWPLWRPSLMWSRPLEFFNELAGGPANGYSSLVDSNLDWGQGLAELSDWLERQGIEEPINLCYFGTADPRFYQIRHVRMPCRYLFSPPLGPNEPYPSTIAPGYVAVSATHLQGVWATESQRQARQQALATSELVDRVGYSLFIYRIPDLESQNRDSNE